MYWCHVCWLRFWWDKLVVDGGQMVSLVHGRCSLFYIYVLLHFPLELVGSSEQYFGVICGH